MPIIDVDIVAVPRLLRGNVSAPMLATAVAQVLDVEPGRLWLRLRWLDASLYAENGAPIASGELPVFVTVQHAHLPPSNKIAFEAIALTNAVAKCVGCESRRVHVNYAPPGAGRQFFGGIAVE